MARGDRRRRAACGTRCCSRRPPDGAFSHLELSTPAGLLTLHPEGDGTLHGNAIEAGGIRHVVGLPWDAGGVVDIEGSAIAGGACALSARRRRSRRARSARRTLLRVTAGLLITTGPALVERIDAETWRIAGGQPFRTDATGLPLLADAEAWPLEQSEPATDSR